MIRPWEQGKVPPIEVPPVPAAQAALPITPSVADKITSGGVWATNTAVTTLAPAVGSMVPGVNPSGAGGWEVAALGNGVLVIVQAMQTLEFRGHKFDRDRWGPWVIVVLGLAICWLLWVLVPTWLGVQLDALTVQKGVLNGFGTIYNSFQAFGPLSKLGVLAGQAKEEGIA